MTRRDPTRRPTTLWARVPWPACALAVVLWAGPAWPQTPSAAEPPSIERVFIDAGGRSELEGEGRPGDVVQLLSGGVAIGEAKVGANRRWRAVLKDGLKPGTHQIRADARAGGAGPAAAGDEIRVAVPAEIGRPAVVEYDGVTGETDRATRQRAEELADAAGKAYDAVTGNTADRAAPASPAGPSEAKRAPEDTATGALSVVIEWLKRSAREYRQDVVQKLGQAPSEGPVADAAKDDTEKPVTEKSGTEKSGTETADAAKPDTAKNTAPKNNGVAADDAAKAIAAERAAAQARRVELAEAETARKAAEAKAAADAARKREELKRQQAEDLARRKAEADKRIKDELERLKKAKEEADRAKASPRNPPATAKVTLERFYLPGEKKPDVDEAETPGEFTPRTADVEERDDVRPRAASRCAVGRVTQRKGRRWYVTGANDTLWDIAERFYGSGLAYPKIYRVNRKRLSSPHVVRPCLALRLPGRRG